MRELMLIYFSTKLKKNQKLWNRPLAGWGTGTTYKSLLFHHTDLKLVGSYYGPPLITYL